MSTLKNLIAARAMITNPADWCKGARDDGGGRKCALGAIDAVIDEGLGSCDYGPEVKVLASVMTREEKYTALKWLTFGGEITDTRCEITGANIFVAQFNNATGHAAVLALFDRAIARQRTMDQIMSGVFVCTTHGVGEKDVVNDATPALETA